MTHKTRNLRLATGVMTSVRLTNDEWTAIEHAAHRHGMRWPAWARRVIQSEAGTTNRSALLRRAAIEDALAADLVAGRKEQLRVGRELSHPMLHQRYCHLDGQAVAGELQQAQIDYRADFTSYELIAGHRQRGEPFILVRNKLEDTLSTLLLRDKEE